MARKFFTRGRLWGLGLIVFSWMGFSVPSGVALLAALMGWSDNVENWPRWVLGVLGGWIVLAFPLTWIGLVLLIRGKCTPPWTFAALGLAWVSAVLFGEILRHHYHV